MAGHMMIEETEAQHNARMARISAEGPIKKSPATPRREVLKPAAIVDNPAFAEILTPFVPSVETPKPKSKVITSDAELDEVLDTFDRRA